MAYSISDLRGRIRTRRYVVTHHAADELEDDGLTLFDLENIVLSGTIVRRPRDRKTQETKYIIRGRTRGGRHAEAIAKVGLTGTVVFITVYVV